MGVAKKLCLLEDLQQNPELRPSVQAAAKRHLRRKGDSFPLRGQSGRMWGKVGLLFSHGLSEEANI